MSFENETVVETKTCKQCEISFDITDKDVEFYEKVSPIFWGKKYSIPTPRLCPDCRQQRRLSFRNEKTLYKRKCDATGKQIISMYSPESIHTVYHHEFWWSDSWNPIDYQQEYDWRKTFFHQMKELYKIVPRTSVFRQWENINSEYTNVASNNKDCYLLFSSNYNENCVYGIQNNTSSFCIDCLNIVDTENSYELIASKECYGCFYSQYLFSCSDVWFSKNCESCQQCFLCTNLRNKKYCIENVSYSAEKYKEKKKQVMEKYTPQELKIKLEQMSQNTFTAHYMWKWNEGSFGDYIFDSKNTKSSFECVNCEDVKYGSVLIDAKNCMDYSYWGRGCENIYESHGIGYNCFNILFCTQSPSDNKNLLYCDFCSGWIQDCFWCIGLHSGERYCILNKQYTKEEYNALVPKIIEKMKQDGEWWELFSMSLSSFGYNETVAQDYFPLKKEQARELWTNWSDYFTPTPLVEKIISAKKLPSNIFDVPDDILNWAIECEVTKKPFRILPQELDFYRKHQISIPRIHPDQRHLDRIKLKNPRKLFKRKCDKCNINIQTTYSSKRKEKVYCWICYEKEVY